VGRYFGGRREKSIESEDYHEDDIISLGKAFGHVTIKKMQEMPSMHAFGAIRMSFFIGPKPTKL
jgi:hypothetical protein